MLWSVLVGAADLTGLFVSFEGIDRAGKSTQVRLLGEVLGERAIAVREPGGTPVGERVRELVKDRASEIDPRTEALLFAAARAELVARVIRPALAEGRIVICDRFLDSSLAYQGVGRGLGVGEIARINAFGTQGLAPDITLLLRLDPQRAAARAGERDRFESEGAQLQRDVLDAYESLAQAEPERFRTIRADRPAEEVHRDVLAAVEAALAGAPA